MEDEKKQLKYYKNLSAFSTTTTTTTDVITWVRSVKANNPRVV